MSMTNDKFQWTLSFSSEALQGDGQAGLQTGL
jgi:hypothetical protein